MSDRDAEIERICQAALDCPAESRTSLVIAQCAGDESMRREVEGLLALETAADRFMEGVTKTPTLAVPSRFGSYEILSVLGNGGMGDVYRARDMVLGRDVAVKMLPPSLADNVERLARFQREARILASLNHPNIAQIYGVEQNALIMELVEGETLKAALPIGIALDYAGQIAAALEAAHEKGIVHRDVKPANVMTTAQGVVKVLDFGVAAMESEPPRESHNSAEETDRSVIVTRAGAIIGTASYMSPEQASGRPVDKRADIWAFGVVVWEMLTGQQLFHADTVSATLSKVMTAPVDFRQLPRETPTAIRDLLARCLERDVRTRLRDIGEARIQIQRYLTETPRAKPTFSRQKLAWAATWVSIALAVVLATLLVSGRRDHAQAEILEPVRFDIPVPPQTTVVGGPAFSPDGRRIAFTAKSADGRVRIWVHSLNSADVHVMAGTEDAFSPLFWSPDSRYVGFASGMALKKVAVTGGPPFTLCDRCGPSSIGSRVFRGGTWNAAGVIVYAISSNGLWRLPDSGGTPVRLTPAGDYGYPDFLPDGEQLLYTWFGRDPLPGVYVGNLRRHEQRPSKRLIDGAFVLSVYASRGHAPDGYLLALREGVLTARSFDPITGALSGEPAVIAQDVPAVEPPAAFSVSSTGAIAFSRSTSADSSRLKWFDRNGKELGQLGPRSYGSNINISPDGRQITFDTIESDRRSRHIWTADAVRNLATVMNSGPREWVPVASSDGFVAFSSSAGMDMALPSATGPPVSLYRAGKRKVPNDWSPDGRFLTFNELHPTRRSDLYVLRLKGREPIPLVVTDADELPAVFSPDGKWIAYSSDETGSREVYVRDFAPDRTPAVGAVKVRVSTEGGDKPDWSADGAELYYISADGRLTVVAVKTTPTFDVGSPVALFEVHVPKGSFFPYAVAHDGRFLVDTLDGPSIDPLAGMTVILNWMSR